MRTLVVVPFVVPVERYEFVYCQDVHRAFLKDLMGKHLWTG